LSAICGGINTRPEIEAALGGKSVGGHLNGIEDMAAKIEHLTHFILIPLFSRRFSLSLTAS
jgi:hypothetical protein